MDESGGDFCADGHWKCNDDASVFGHVCQDAVQECGPHQADGDREAESVGHDALEVIHHHGLHDHVRHTAEKLSGHRPILHSIVLCRAGNSTDRSRRNLSLRFALSEGIIGRSRLNFYEIQDLPLFLRRFWALKRECSELHDR